MATSIPSSSARSGYITDVVYPAHFHRETMPVWLVCVLTALGRRAPDLRRPYGWLELGCGDGLGVVVAAACNPLGRFVGLDFNAEAIGRAKALAASAGLSNARFHCLSFSQADERWDDWGETFDFVVSHGVYSWIAPAQRQALLRIASRCLKPGGVLYLAYMSHPGSVSFSAAQRLMRMAAARVPEGGTAAQAQAGVALLQRLAQGGAGYFVEHASARREVERMGRGDAAYLAHELLNEHWDALHVAEVIADLQASGLAYAGSATPLENIDAISLPGGTQPLLAELLRAGAGIGEIETFKDIARNQNLRRDIYQRSAAPGDWLLPPQEHRAALLAQRVCLLPAAPADLHTVTGELVFDTRIGPVRLPAAHALPLLQALHQGPRSYGELAALPAYARQPGFVSQLLQVLAWAGWLHPLRPDATPAAETVHRLQQDIDALPVSLASGPIVASSAIGSAWPQQQRDLTRESRYGLHGA